MSVLSPAYRTPGSPLKLMSEIFMDWFEAVNHIRNNRNSRNVPIVAIDCVSILNKPTEFSMKYYKAAISDLFKKPFTLSKLRAVLKKYIYKSVGWLVSWLVELVID